MPPNYQLHSGDPQGIDLSKVRPLSTIERSYIQTFPDSFKFSGTKTNLEQVIGNAVPINLAFFVASAIVNYIKNKNLDQNKLETFQINQQLCLHF
jgi:DNA (cytosine-5)-methyltransferase 1